MGPTPFTLIRRNQPRDFHEEFKPLLESLDPTFKPEQASMWTESLPASTPAETSDKQLVACDQKLDSLTLDQNRLHYEADSLALARDAAMLARLFGDEAKTERADRQSKVFHLRQENQIGSSLITKHMENRCKFMAATSGELQLEIGKAGLWHLFGPTITD